MSGRRVKPRERRKIVEIYKKGLTIPEVAKIVGRTPQTVKRHLEAADVPVRQSRTGVDPKEVVRLYTKEMLSLRQINRRLGVSYGTVHRIVANSEAMRPPTSRAEHRQLREEPAEEDDGKPAAAAGAA